MRNARRKVVAANWKMNGTRQSSVDLLQRLNDGGRPGSVDVIIAPPFVYLAELAKSFGQGFAFAAQDISAQVQGAYTGEVSAAMVADCGGSYAIIGHSERRQYHHEANEMLAQKLRQALAAGLSPVFCVGETLAERESGVAESVLAEQLNAVADAVKALDLAKLLVAYEPVWAIGTGKTATAAQAQAAHSFIRGQLAEIDANIAARISILYGGSVKPANAAELFSQPDIDGGLIGGASLVAEDFSAIIKAAAVAAND